MSRPAPSWLRRHPVAAPSFADHAWTTADGPDFAGDPTAPAHARPVTDLCAAAGAPTAAWVRQVHGGTVLQADAPGCAGEADALWTDRPGLAVVGRSADCPLVLVAGPGLGGRLWGFAHASWRSTAAGITGALLAAMIEAGLRPGLALAVICPSAGPCCYEVGDEVRAAMQARFGAAASGFNNGRNLDLWAAARHELETAGLLADRIHIAGECTICGDGYPSYRRDGAAAGRFAAICGD